MLLLFSPYLFYIYEFAPIDSKEWDLGIIKISSLAFPNVQFMLHAAFSKLFPFLFLSIAYFNIGRRWKYFFMVPITMYLYQFLGVIGSSTFIDGFSFWYSLPVVLPCITLIIYLDRKIKLYALNADLDEFIDEEIKRLTNKKSEVNE